MSADILEARAIKASLVGVLPAAVTDQLLLTASRGGGEYHYFSPAQVLKTTQTTGYQP